MKRATVNGVELEYEITGTGEPVLLISPVLADGFLPFMSERSLTDRYRLIRYHKRGWAGSTHTVGPVSVADHVADAAALLQHLDIPRAHIAGHSTGGVVALQMALDRPEIVHSLILLEPSMLCLPGAGAFFEAAGPAFEAFGAGDHKNALSIFMTAASGLDWERCRAFVDERIPGAMADALEDAETFFGVELAALTQWTFDSKSAATIVQPTLSVVGANTQPLWQEIAELFRTAIPRVEELRIEGAGHLLHLQRPEPVVRGIAAFLERHVMTASPDFTAIKQKQQKTWASGDYAVVGTTLQIVGERLCEAVDVRADERVLDVAAGNGNASLAAARHWCKVTATDYVGALLDRAKERATAERLSIEFQQADAEALPFADDSYDVVLSTFGVMFAPDQDRAASELARVCRKGGRIGLANWTPEGFIGQLFKTIGKHVPPPAGVKSPALWGTEARLKALFGPHDVKAERRMFHFRYRSAAHWLEVFETYYGPTNRAFAALDAPKQAALRADLVELLTRMNRGGPDTLIVPSEYLEVVVIKR